VSSLPPPPNGAPQARLGLMAEDTSWEEFEAILDSTPIDETLVLETLPQQGEGGGRLR
jgi:hypothetical protein